MYPKEYIEYLVHFHGDRDYFECHELLEDYWKKVDKNNKRSILVGFILLAVSNYHHRRQNYKGAARTLTKALDIFQEQQQQLTSFGFSSSELLGFLNNRLLAIQNKEQYTSLVLPIQDSTLIEECKKTSKQKGFVWTTESDLANVDLVHRHSRRDRSDVILERTKALQERQKNGMD